MSLQDIYSLQREIVHLQWRNLEDATLIKSAKLITIWELTNTLCLRIHSKKNTGHFFGIPAKNAESKSNPEEISDNPKLKDILPNNWPVTF